MNLYFEASRCLDKLDAKRGSIKSVLSSFPSSDRTRGAALLIETLKYKPTLITIIKSSTLLESERKHLKSLNLALLLVHDLLFARGIQAGDGPVKQAVLRHKARLQSELARLKIAKGVTSNAQLAVQVDEGYANIPRYVRVNTCLWTGALAKEHFQAQGLTFRAEGPIDKDSFTADAHIPDLLIMHAGIKLHEDSAYLSGKIILQDKASCMPAFILSPPAHESTVVIDATAAPGNKTSHLSALMQNRGKIYAFERDKRRFETLTKLLSKNGCLNIVPTNADFLAIDPLDKTYADVTHILVDPSCSGSGIVNRMDYLIEPAEQEDFDTQQQRLAWLASFQVAMVLQAMKFPSVQKIVYSTCSVHAAENEHVVRQVCYSEEFRSNGFSLADRKDVIPSWPRRGLTEELGCDGDSLIRCKPGEDATNGFFVALFIRNAPSSISILVSKNKEGSTGKKRERQAPEGESSVKRNKKKRKSC